MREGARGIQSIEVSGRILRALVEAAAPMMLKDLALAADLAPAQCHAYLTSLRHVGLVRQQQNTGFYQIGPFAMRLGMSWLKSSQLASTAIRDLKALTDEVGALSVIAVWGQSGPTIVHINTGPATTDLNLRQGTLFSVTGTATGRVFAAFGHDDAVERKIAAELAAPFSSRSIGTTLARAEFDAQLAVTRAKGFSIAEGAPIPDINAVSAPVFDPDRRLVFVATLIGPSGELPVGDTATPVVRLLEVTRALADTAAREAGATAPLEASR